MRFAQKATRYLQSKKIDRDFLDYRIEHEDGWTGGSIPPVQISQMEKILLDAAQLDQKYFEVIIETHDSILELDHLRSSLERHVGNWNAGVDKFVIESFYHYVSDEAPLIEQALERLGKAAGGTIPLKPRVR